MSEIKSKLYLSLLGKEEAIGIGKEVVKALGVPEYITFKVKDNKRSIIIIPCEKEDVMSFKVPEEFLKPHSHRNFRLYSKEYVIDLLKNLGLETNKSHYFYGTYSGDINGVVFMLKSDDGGATNA